MRQTTLIFALPFALGIAPLGMSGCSSDTPPHEEAIASTGTLSLPLVTTTNGHTYRLTGTLYVSGPVFNVFDLGSDELTTNVPTGEYYVYLISYALQQLDEAGIYQPIQANLLSSYYQQVTIYNQTTTTVTYEFETDGVIVKVGAGNLAVDVKVTERAPVCTILGNDCGEGSWCAPPELTGQPLACVGAGTAAPGEACDSPRDCGANSSCYDFGGGSECAALCGADAFDTACPGGGTCTASGATYGVCIPASAGGEGGAGGAGG
jgi:hypothetical protein